MAGDVRAALDDIAKGRARPLYIVNGDDHFLRHQWCKSLIEALVPEAGRDTGVFVLDGPQANAAAAVDDLRSPSLFGGGKTIWLKDTTLFCSGVDKAELFTRAGESWLQNKPEVAARWFLRLLSALKWTLEDARSPGAHPDAEWEKALGSESGTVSLGQARSWIEPLCAFCLDRELSPPEPGVDETLVLDAAAGGLPPGNHLIISGDRKLDSAWAKPLAVHAVILLCQSPVKEGKPEKILPALIAEAAQAEGVRLSGVAAKLMAGRVIPDRELIYNEMRKLALFADGQEIQPSDIHDLVADQQEDPAYKIAGNLAENRLEDALEMIAEFMFHHPKPGDVFMLSATLENEVRRWLMARIAMREFNIRVRMGFWPADQVREEILGRMPDGGESIFGKRPSEFRAAKVFQAAANRDEDELIRMLAEFQRLDRRLKSSRLPPRLLLEQTVLNCFAPRG
ncbi:MAG: hypothetical protein GMKNLPBB_01287 [Myxococcota bacterium]|nr:hypothetical protein [Myxococcota bacterium]